MKKKTFGTIALSCFLSASPQSDPTSFTVEASGRSPISPVSEAASFEEDVAAANRLDLTRLGAPVGDGEEAE